LKRGRRSSQLSFARAAGLNCGIGVAFSAIGLAAECGSAGAFARSAASMSSHFAGLQVSKRSAPAAARA
jgi:hypothetical protein